MKRGGICAIIKMAWAKGFYTDLKAALISLGISIMLLVENMEKILTKIYKNRPLSKTLGVISHIITLLFVLAFLFCEAIVIYAQHYRVAISMASSALVGYLLVSAAREVLDAPRPYELYDFYEILPKRKKGKSFPSRHAYSAFAIATLSFAVGFPLGIILTLLGIIMCACRALLGIHFIRDLAAGAALGIVSGALGLLLI